MRLKIKPPFSNPLGGQMSRKYQYAVDLLPKCNQRGWLYVHIERATSDYTRYNRRDHSATPAYAGFEQCHYKGMAMQSLQKTHRNLYS